MTRDQFNSTVNGLGFDADTLEEGGMIMLSSSNLFGVAYDFNTLTLIVGFTAGTSYQYNGVPKAQIISLLSAGSHGSYFFHNIRTSYPYQRL